jgi:hypothetical protein
MSRTGPDSIDQGIACQPPEKAKLDQLQRDIWREGLEVVNAQQRTALLAK